MIKRTFGKFTEVLNAKHIDKNNLIIPDEIILTKIYLVRGQKVMLDRDLAELYDIKAIRLHEQVKRNLAKFPNHFMFQLTKEEVEIMVSQNAIPSKQHLGGALPYVFTEYGVEE